MQIFLPYLNIIEVAECLDKRRLHKQIVECKQIIKAIKGETEAWSNHPIVKMYKNNLEFVQAYLNILEIYWNLYKTEDKFNDIICDVRKAKSRKDLDKYGKLIDIPNSLGEFFYQNKIADFWEFNENIQKLIPDFITDKYLFTMRGRLFKKDSVWYLSFAPYEEYGKYNMYFIDGEWKYYEQK